MIIALVRGTVKLVVTVVLAIIVLGVVFGFILWVGDNPHQAGNAVTGFFGDVWDTVKGWATFGKEIADQ